MYFLLQSWMTISGSGRAVKDHSTISYQGVQNGEMWRLVGMDQEPTDGGAIEVSTEELRRFSRLASGLPVLALLIIASAWLPALLAGYGVHVATADHAELVAQAPEEPPAQPPHDCEASVQVFWPDTYGFFREQRFVETMNEIEELNLPRPNVTMSFDDRAFPGRDPATFATGSYLAKRQRVLSFYEPAVWELLACYRLHPHGRGIQPPGYMYIVNFLTYQLHHTAWRRDWAAFEQALQDLLLVSERWYGHPLQQLDGPLIVVLQLHGHAMPADTLERLRELLVPLASEPIDPVASALEHGYEQRVRYAGSVVRAADPESRRRKPLFLMAEAMAYPPRPGQIDAMTAELVAELPRMIETPGFTYYRRADEDAPNAWMPTVLRSDQIQDLGRNFAHGQQRQYCYARVKTRLLLAAIDTLRYLREHQAWPPDIAALGEPALRVDPYSTTAAPLLMRVDETGALRLWVRTGNGTDNGGYYPDERPTRGRSSAGIMHLEPPPEEAP